MSMLLSDLLKRPVRGDSGWTFGTVHDVRVNRSGGRATVCALLVGRSAVRERLFGRTSLEQHGTHGHGFEIPWAEVVTVEQHEIRIKEAS